MCCALSRGMRDESRKKLLVSAKSYGSMARDGPDIGKLENGLPKAEFVKKRTEHKKYRSSGEKPDGGWGWLVVLGVSISNMTSQALISLFGLLFSDRLAELQIETGGAAVILSMQTTVLNLSGFLIGPAIKRFSYRKVCLLGAFSVVSGLLLTLLADSLWSFCLTYSLWTGIGLGLLYPSTFYAINSYFSKRRGFAVGISVAGTGMGQMLLPLLIRYLLDEFGFQGTILILAGISAHSIVGATLYQPVEWHMKRTKRDEKKPAKGKIESRFSAQQSQSTASLDTVELDENELRSEKIEDVENKMQKKVEKVEKKNVVGSMWSKVVKIMDWDLLKNPSFLNLIIGLGMAYCANMSFQMLFPFYIEDLGYEREEVAESMSILSAADIVGRLLVPVLADNLGLTSRGCFFVGALLSAVARSYLVMQTDLMFIMVTSGVIGLIRSALVVNFNLSISENATPEKLPAALGLHMVVKGICIISFGPLIGYVRDMTQSYSLCIHLLSLLFLVLPFCTWFLEVIILKIKDKFCKPTEHNADG